MTPPSKLAWRRVRSRIEIVVTAEERARLERVALENRGGLARVIRDAVNEYVSDYSDTVVFIDPKGRRR